MIPEKYGIERVSVSALTAFSGNPRTHSDTQIDQIAASIREFGWTNPILVDADGTIIAVSPLPHVSVSLRCRSSG